MYDERDLETGSELLCRVTLLLLHLLKIGYDIIHGLVPACFHPVRATFNLNFTLPLSDLTLPGGSIMSVFRGRLQKLKLTLNLKLKSYN